MKKLLFFVLALIAISAKAQFTENVGTPASTTGVSIYNGWQGNGVYTYSGTADVRTSTASSGYTGASGNGNIFFTNTIATTPNVQISGINTLSLTNPAISFGLFKSLIASDALDFKFEYSTDGTNFTQITLPVQLTGVGTANWRLITLTGLPNTTTLTIRFTNTNILLSQYRIDDIQINSLAVLPVSLTSFTGKANNQAIDLNWQTALEQNNAHFDILRSVNDKNFSSIGQINGFGTTSNPHNYTFTDSQPNSGINYYQLKQIDLDGRSTLSDVIAIKSNVAASSFNIAANRDNNSLDLNVFASTDGTAQLTIFDAVGKKNTTKTLNLTKGYNTFNLPTTNTGAGVHIATLSTANEIITHKFIQ